MTLAELKRELRDEIRQYKNAAKELKGEFQHISRESGHVHQSMKYEQRAAIENQIQLFEYFYKRLAEVKKLR